MTSFRLLLGATLLSVTGCGLISSDVTNFDLTLPDKNFSVDGASWNVDQQTADAVLSQSCAGNPGICSTAAQAACPMNCDGACNASSQTCDLTFDISLYQGVDLLMEKPELQSINDEPVIKVTIDSVTWEVTANTLNTATPPMNVYVAPMTVMDPNSPDAQQIGTIDAVAAGEVTDGPRQIAFTPTGKMALVSIMSTFKTPFNIIVGSSITVSAGDMVPQGKLDAVVHVKGHAGI